jgi:hypothetical protein
LFHEEEKEEEVVGVVVGMEYLMSFVDVGMQVFSIFLGLEVGGDGIFCVPSGCGDGTSRDLGGGGEPSEEGTCTVLCELQGICTIACERDIHVGAPLMSIRHLLHCNLCP